MSRVDADDLMVGVSRSLLEPDWSWPVHGLRHPAVADHAGWYCWTGDLRGDVNFFVALHLRHLIERIPELAELLELGPGSRFLVAPGHLDVWEDVSLLDV